MYICLCNAVTESHIARAVDGGAACMEQLRRELGVATECGRCASCAKECLKETIARRGSGAANGV